MTFDEIELIADNSDATEADLEVLRRVQFQKDIEFLINAPEFYEHIDMEERQVCLRDREYARQMAQFIFEHRVHQRTAELLAEDQRSHNWQGEGF